MNFDTPIAHSGFSGYLVVTGAMIAASVGLVGVAWWKGWV
jgi:Mg2+ and Co2+ transporter CorA